MNINDKTIRYISVGIGTLITLAVLYIKDEDRYLGFFAPDIKHTMVYDLLRDILREFGLRSWSWEWAYCLWFACLAGGVWFSWKMRYKIANVITKIIESIRRVIKNIHEKI